jgi:UDP-N-acetylmuramoylalanine--D-glutamate ligase
MDLQKKRVLVLGLAMTGRSAANHCARLGAEVVAADERPIAALGDLSDLAPGIEVHAGAPFPDPADFDLTVPSPGVPLARYSDRARKAWGDIELAWRALEVPVVAVTGTNGKSTTVRLIEAMLGSAGLRAKAAGNVGAPALSLPGEPLDVAVLEVSSFQLESIEAFRPKVALVLNVTPDHLDRHGDLEGYAAAKRRMLMNQQADDVAVLNFDDPIVRGFAAAGEAQVIPFSLKQPLSVAPGGRAVWLDTGAVVLADDSGIRRISLDSLGLAGRHNLENTVAAFAAVWAVGAEPERALQALAGFSGLPHRCELVGRANDVSWINDSKATNPGAAVRSLESFTRSLVWIAGGRDKGLSYDTLAEVASERVARVLLIGEAAPLIEQSLAGRVACENVGDLESAVARAAEITKPGDVVLLAPACASYDQFESFEARGDCFRAAVARLDAGGER